MIRLRSVLSLIPLLAVLAAPARAQEPAASTGDVQARLREMEAQLLALQSEMSALRQQLADRPADAEPSDVERKVDALAEEMERQRTSAVLAPVKESEWGLGPAASKIYSVEKGLAIGGYGEALLQEFDESRDDGQPSGRRDQVDLLRLITYFGYKFNDRILFNSEIEYEHANTSADGEVEVELAYLDFLFRDEINARAGLMLAPVGFINELHEPPTFLGARRPDVESRIIPTTWAENGAGVFGEIGPVSYRAYVMAGLDATGFTAGSGLRNGRQKGSNSLSEDFALAARVDVTPVPAFTFGGSLFTGGAGQDAKLASGAEVDAGVTLWDVHAEARWRGVQARALYASVSVDDAAKVNELNGLTGSQSIGRRMHGWYVQLGYDVLTRRETAQELVPFARWEELDTQDRVPAGFMANPANDVEILTVGVSYKPHPNVVLKLDRQAYSNAAGTGVDQWNAALGFQF